MKKLIISVLLLAGASPLAFAGTGTDNDLDYEQLDRVERFSALNGIYSWTNVDDDSIIVWATPRRPYLIDLGRKSHGLSFANTIGVTSSTGQIHAKFDSVIVDGIRYPIKGIYKLDRETARSLKQRS